MNKSEIYEKPSVELLFFSSDIVTDSNTGSNYNDPYNDPFDPGVPYSPMY